MHRAPTDPTGHKKKGLAGPFLSRRLFLPSLVFKWPVFEYVAELALHLEDGLCGRFGVAAVDDDGGFALDECLGLLAGFLATVGRYYHANGAGLNDASFIGKLDVGGDGEVHNGELKKA